MQLKTFKYILDGHKKVSIPYIHWTFMVKLTSRSHSRAWKAGVFCRQPDPGPSSTELERYRTNWKVLWLTRLRFIFSRKASSYKESKLYIRADYKSKVADFYVCLYIMCSYPRQTLYPLMRFISCCMAELVSSTDRRTLTAAYRELSSGAIATRLRTTVGPPTYRKPLDAVLGVNIRTPRRKRPCAY